MFDLYNIFLTFLYCFEIVHKKIKETEFYAQTQVKFYQNDKIKRKKLTKEGFKKK